MLGGNQGSFLYGGGFVMVSKGFGISNDFGMILTCFLVQRVYLFSLKYKIWTFKKASCKHARIIYTPLKPTFIQ